MRSINRYVSLLFRMGERFLNRELVGSSISSGTAPLLLELRDGEARNPVTLAGAVGVDKAYITRALQSLKRAGYVAVVLATADGRSVTVSLTREDRATAGRSYQHPALILFGLVRVFNQGEMQFTAEKKSIALP